MLDSSSKSKKSLHTIIFKKSKGQDNSYSSPKVDITLSRDCDWLAVSTNRKSGVEREWPEWTVRLLLKTELQRSGGGQLVHT